MEGGSNSRSHSGMPNVGNTCYLNSVLQILKNTISTEDLLEKKDESMLCTILLSCFQNSTTKSMDSLVEYLSQHFNQDFRKQSDAAELLLKLFSLFEEEECDSILKLFAIKKKSLIYDCSDCDFQYHEMRLNKKVVYCIPWSGPNGMSTKDLLNNTLSPSRDMFCPTCQHEKKMTGKLEVELPQQLFIVSTSPYQTRYRFDQQFTISEEIEYELTGVTVHQGRSGISGHYVAKIRDKIMKNWTCCNDSHILPTTLEDDDIVTLLLYSKSNNLNSVV